MPNLVVRLETGTQTAGDGQELQEQGGTQKKIIREWRLLVL